jgi:hypothetical protein
VRGRLFYSWVDYHAWQREVDRRRSGQDLHCKVKANRPRKDTARERAELNAAKRRLGIKV